MKRVTPGPISKAALRDPYVELDVSGRQLTDEGFAEIAAALSTLKAQEREHGNVVRLAELCLTGNALTAGSLLALASVVRVAAVELRDLDLSDNDITVKNAEDAVAWEEFLRSFRTCSVLRRLNLGGNELGSRAYEILARGDEEVLEILAVEEGDLGVVQEGLVQGEHETIDDGVGGLIERAGRMKVGPATQDDAEHSLADVKEGSRRRRSRKGELSQAVFNFPTYLLALVDSSASKTVLPHPSHAVEAQSLFATTRGLRSIPYIIVTNTSMTDVCALHLSCVLEYHNLPKQLLQYVPAKAGALAHEHEAYDTTSGCQGIVYLPNDQLSSVGLKVLEVAELVRKGAESEPFQWNASPSKSSRMTSTHTRGISDTSFGPSSSPSHRRRRSTLSSISHGGAAPSVASELDRARSRIQVSMLKELGPQSVELWIASLRMLSIARLILLANPKEQLHGGGNTLGSKSLGNPASKPTYASKLKIGVSVPGEPVLATAGISNTPTTPVTPPKRKGSNVPTSRQTSKLTSTIQADTVPVVIITSPGPPPPPLGLSEALWRRIIALASGAVGVISSEQQESIIRWAKKRETLGREREALGKAESEQIWRVLEGMGCLSYEVKI